MLNSLETSFLHAIRTGNIALFDSLFNEYKKLPQEEKNFLLEQTVMQTPSLEFLTHLFSCGADINYVPEGQGGNLLHFAACSDHPEILKFFLSKEFPIDSKDKQGNTPLGLAASHSASLEVVKILIEAGADINLPVYGNENLLISAAGRNPNLEITKFFIDKFDLESRDGEGYTPFLNAMRWQSNPEVIDYLKNCGANLDAVDNDGNTAFHLAIMNDNPQILSYVENRFLTSECNKVGETCIERALVFASSTETLEICIEKMKFEHMLLASLNRNPSIITKLFEMGYDINSFDAATGMTVLMYAAKNNPLPAMVQNLILCGANQNTLDRRGRNFAHYAAANSDSTIFDWISSNEIIKYLLDQKDFDGNLPSYYHDHQDEF